MDFLVEQTFTADPAAVARAYTDPGLHALIGAASSLGRPEVLDRRDDDGVVVMAVRYRYVGELSPTARRALDPDTLSWVEHATHDLARGHVRFRLVPDHHADRFRAAGECVLAPGGGAGDAGGTVRTVRGSLRVHAPFVGGAVERAIVSGLRDHLRAEADAVDRFLAPSGRADGADEAPAPR